MCTKISHTLSLDLHVHSTTSAASQILDIAKESCSMPQKIKNELPKLHIADHFWNIKPMGWDPYLVRQLDQIELIKK